VIFSRDCLRTVFFIIAAIFEAESDGAGGCEAQWHLLFLHISLA
jgi:hypothetical protein